MRCLQPSAARALHARAKRKPAEARNHQRRPHGTAKQQHEYQRLPVVHNEQNNAAASCCNRSAPFGKC